MKRSLINEIIGDAERFIGDCRFYLPPFASWTIEEWRRRGQDVAQIAEYNLGWDITDFGLGNFQKDGLTLLSH